MKTVTETKKVEIKKVAKTIFAADVSVRNKSFDFRINHKHFGNDNKAYHYDIN